MRDLRQGRDVLQMQTHKEEEVSEQYQPMETAPRDGSTIIGLYDEGEAHIFWSDRPVCMLGTRCGGYPPGWATNGDGVDHSLPVDAPKAWRSDLTPQQPRRV